MKGISSRIKTERQYELLRSNILGSRPGGPGSLPVSLGQQLAAAPSFITVDFPSATTTHLWGINSRGEMVGLYIAADASLIGFLLIGDHFTSIDFPGASLTEAYGINVQGDVVGTYMTTGDVTHGFVLSGGRFTTIDFPGASYTGPAGITARGDVEGHTLNGVKPTGT